MKNVGEVTRDVVVVAREVEGHCEAGIKPGDKIVTRGANICLDETDVMCGYAFSSIFPTLFAVRMGVDLEKLGLSGRRWQCVDAGPPHNPGGRVLFEIIPKDEFKG